MTGSTLIGTGTTNTTYGSVVTLVVPSFKGYYYNKNTGKFEGHSNQGVGNTNDVYACTGTTGNGQNISYTGITRLEITHEKFQKCAKIILKEAGAPVELEFMYIAYAAYNASHRILSSIYSKFMSGYSSVPNAEKTPLADNINSEVALYSRKALISVFMELPDPTFGANYWDGTDFLAWGLNSPYQGGIPHAKFRQNRSIKIPRNIYDRFLARTLEKYPSGHVSYFGHQYNIPAAVFLNSQNWATGDFYFETGYSSLPRLEATVTAGHTIFWRKTPDA